MAEKNRRGDDPAEVNVDDVIDEAVDDDAATVSRSGGTATRTRTKAGADDRSTKAKKETGKKETGKVGLFGRLGRFFREVVAELRKVMWPTRKEMLTYTSVVIVFVTVIVALVAGLDFAFAKGALAIFGSSE